MPAKKLFSIFVLSVGALWFGARAWAADNTPLQEMDPDIAKQYGGMIAERFAKENKNTQVKIDPNLEKAVGLFNPGTNEGIIAIPTKNLKEDRENKEAEKECGVGLCFLLMSQSYNPLIDGKPIDAKKLRKVKYMDPEGNEKEATCLLCSIRHIEGDDWQLYVYGADKEPLIKSPWGEASDAPKGDLVLTIQDPTKESASLVFNIFGKYASMITINHKGEATAENKTEKNTPAKAGVQTRKSTP
jgi:hypothetical protein